MFGLGPSRSSQCVSVSYYKEIQLQLVSGGCYDRKADIPCQVRDASLTHPSPLETFRNFQIHIIFIQSPRNNKDMQCTICINQIIQCRYLRWSWVTGRVGQCFCDGGLCVVALSSSNHSHRLYQICCQFNHLLVKDNDMTPN